MSDAFKPVSVPLAGIMFDARSSADQQVANSLAWVQNFQTNPDGKLQQAQGFARPYDNNISVNNVPCPYKNWDFHDQGQTDQTKLEAPTLLFYSTANDGTRRWYMGTKTKCFLLDETAGAWNQLTNNSGLGNDGTTNLVGTRWKAGQLQDNIFFANGLDPLQYTAVGSTTLQEVTNLQTAGSDGQGGAAPITAPNVIIQYQGVLLIMNLTENGVRQPSRIWWSDLNDGTFWGVGISNPTTSIGSIADYQDLSYGERILGAVELLGYLYVLTDKSIWQCAFTVSSQQVAAVGNVAAYTSYSASINCVRVYTNDEGDRCLAYPNTLCSDGDSVYYASRDAIYKYNPYMSKPERTEWIFRASNIIFDDGINGQAIDSASCASAVMAYWPARKELHLSWPVPDATYVGPTSCDIVPPVASSGLPQYTLVLNVQWQTCDYRDYGMTCYTNWSSNIAEEGKCNLDVMFMAASSTDYCLKQLGREFNRVTYDFTNKLWTYTGYSPMIRAVLPLGDIDKDKIVKEFLVDGVSDLSGNVFSLRLGMSHTNVPINSNTGNSGIVWHQCLKVPVKTMMTMPPDQYAAKNIRPNLDHNWHRFIRGRFIYFELSIQNASGGTPVIGGVILTRVAAKAILA